MAITPPPNRGSYVWLLSGLFLLVYAGLGIIHTKVPGVEELVTFIEQAQGPYLFLAAFLSIFIEGLYGIGNFFPGATLVVIVAALSSFKGTGFFLAIIVTIFSGWVLSGVVNIILATRYQKRLLEDNVTNTDPIKDRLLLTWFPAFRANYEVAQVADGANPWQVFLSSLRVRALASLAVALCAFIFPFFIDIKQTSNEEGFLSVIAVALISLGVGIYKLKHQAR